MDQLFEEQKEYFKSGETKSYGFRIAALKNLRKSIQKHQNELLKALYQDLKKSDFESYATEIGMVLSEISLAIRKLRWWMRPEGASTPLFLFKAKSSIVREPLGVVLIIAPWNYPFQLLFSPLVGAIAAGNCVVLKPSKDTVATAKVMRKIIDDVFPKEYVVVVDERNEVTNELIRLPFDHIFYTGGSGYGKIVMRAAAENLTPVTLELGGKSPCIVEEDAKVEIAARRIVWGKFLNCGQTCVAPDYVMVHTDVKEDFVAALCRELEVQYGDDVINNSDYSRIINRTRFDHLLELMQGHTVLKGGGSNAKELFIEPTLLDDVAPDSAIMQEEIFGPLLPIIEYDEIDEVLEYLKECDKPLALYYFTEDQKRADFVLRNTLSGGCAINDVVVQVANNRIPFGGVGTSGMGCYHGKYSFRTFSHTRSVVRSSTKVNLKIKFAPYGKKLSILKLFMR